jgi:hypothetical protein
VVRRLQHRRLAIAGPIQLDWLTVSSLLLDKNITSTGTHYFMEKGFALERSASIYSQTKAGCKVEYAWIKKC